MRFGPRCLVNRMENHPGRTGARGSNEVLDWRYEARRCRYNLGRVELAVLVARGAEASEVQDPVVGCEAVYLGSGAAAAYTFAEKLIAFLGALALATHHQAVDIALERTRAMVPNNLGLIGTLHSLLLE